MRVGCSLEKVNSTVYTVASVEPHLLF